MIREIADLGFSNIELSHGIRLSLVPGILRALDENIVKVTSVHNFCPLPPGVTHAAPNIFMPSAQKKREHDQWYSYTCRSLDFAQQVGAGLMVIHLGNVQFPLANPTRKLSSYVRKQKCLDVDEDEQFLKIREGMFEKLRKQMGPYWETVKSSLESILVLAEQNGVILGCENRERLDELPLDEDFPSLLNNLSGPPMARYWHDAGHAHLKEELGILWHEELLEKNAENLAGFHLHDVRKGKDHQPLGSGSIDFHMVRRFFQPGQRLTIELSPRLKKEEVLESRDFLEDLIKDL
ncbi:MAG: sugar phosphate isomerase/epimerase [Opitutaceae bacterium]|nr:sugar phosphate isomerase/epimerase [Opitutaceae bacterium]